MYIYIHIAVLMNRNSTDFPQVFFPSARPTALHLHQRRNLCLHGGGAEGATTSALVAWLYNGHIYYPLVNIQKAMENCYL